MTRSIREEVLEQIVLNDIHNYAELAMEDEQKLAEEIYESMLKEDDLKFQAIKKELEVVEKKHDETSAIIRNLYKDKVIGQISESIFGNLMTGYEQELKELEAKIPELQSKLQKDTESQDKAKRFTELVKNYLSFEKLTRSSARMLIDKIVVSDTYKVGGKDMQDIVVTYRFVGNLENLQQIKKSRLKNF